MKAEEYKYLLVGRSGGMHYILAASDDYEELREKARVRAERRIGKSGSLTIWSIRSPYQRWPAKEE